MEDTFNEAATGIAKKIAPLVGVDKTQIDQGFQQNKPLDALTSAAGKVGGKVLSAPVVGSVLKGAFRGIAPVLKGAYVVYEEGYRRPLTTALLLGTSIPKYSDESQGTFRSLKDYVKIFTKSSE